MEEPKGIEILVKDNAKYTINERAKTKTGEWTAQGFDLDKQIKMRKGGFLEVAGPTSAGFETVQVDYLPAKLWESNIQPGVPTYEPQTGRLLGNWGKVDFQADARKLPLADESVGMLFASCLDNSIRLETAKEAKRVLEPGGLFVFEGLSEQDMKQLEDLGFEVKKRIDHQNKQKVWSFNLIAQKKGS